MTNFYCSFCNGVTLAKPNSVNVEGYVYCPKCIKEYVPVKDQEDDDDEYLYTHKTQEKQPQQQAIIISRNKTKKQEQTPDKFQPLKPEPQHQQYQDPAQAQYNQFLSLYNSNVKTAQQTKSEQVSKKMGEKLIAGWAMLEQACLCIDQIYLECNVPLMRSKKGNLVCCGCDRDYMSNNSKKIDDHHGRNKEEKREEKKVAREREVSPPAPKYQTQQPSKIQQPKPTPRQHHQNKPATQPPKQPSLNPTHKQLAETKITELSLKTLQFLEKRLEQAFQLNDLQAVDRVVRSMKTVKELL